MVTSGEELRISRSFPAPANLVSDPLAGGVGDAELRIPSGEESADRHRYDAGCPGDACWRYAARLILPTMLPAAFLQLSPHWWLALPVRPTSAKVFGSCRGTELPALAELRGLWRRRCRPGRGGWSCLLIGEIASGPPILADRGSDRGGPRPPGMSSYSAIDHAARIMEHSTGTAGLPADVARLARKKLAIPPNEVSDRLKVVSGWLICETSAPVTNPANAVRPALPQLPLYDVGEAGTATGGGSSVKSPPITARSTLRRGRARWWLAGGRTTPSRSSLSPR